MLVNIETETDEISSMKCVYIEFLAEKKMLMLMRSDLNLNINVK